MRYLLEVLNTGVNIAKMRWELLVYDKNKEQNVHLTFNPRCQKCDYQMNEIEAVFRDDDGDAYLLKGSCTNNSCAYISEKRLHEIKD